MPPHPHPAQDVAAYLLLSLAFAVIVCLTLWRARNLETKLILLGLVVSVAAVGYGSLMDNGAAMALGLMRIGLIFVLSGLAVGIVSRCSGTKAAESPPAAAPAPQEPRHEA